jgi:acetyl-CoA synthetase
MSETASGATGSVATYQDFIARFSAVEIEARLSGNLEQGLNACVECCDRHAGEGRVALFWESKDGRSARLTFQELKERSARLANLLQARGVRRGDRVAGLLPRVPDLLVVILGMLRAGAVYQPLFTAFGPKSIEYRVASSGARLIFTDRENLPKLADVASCPPVITVDGGEGPAGAAEGGDFAAELMRQPATFEPVMMRGDDPFLMLFTSGTTGPAKGVSVPLKALLSFYVYTRWALDLRPEDAYWNIADPGWAYGLYYAVIGPLLLGHATTFYDGPFTAESTYRVIGKYGITNLAGAPTAYRLLIAAGAEAEAAVRGKLRVVSSAGETLNPEVIRWFAKVLECPIHDHYGQTEVGMVLCNHHGLSHPVHPGSAGLAMPGFRLAVVDDEARELPVDTPGILAVDRKRSALFWFPGYWQQPTANWVGDYHLTGDTVEKNADGSISFVGRSDDIITSSGYRIGPYDVESALIEHMAVAEAAVVGKPDPQRTELVKAFVVLRPAVEPTPALAGELQEWVKTRLAAHAYPREIEFIDEIPKTPSGKIQRFILRQQEIEKAQATQARQPLT